jgi:tripartite-type tricarboxylate transporter receptor subunit TctC
MTRFRKTPGAAALLPVALLACTSAPGQAQVQVQARTTDAFPARPLRMVVTFPPGGAVDIVGRILGQRLSEVLGQPVLVDNRPGGGQIIGTELVARAAADGYTLLLPSITHSINPALHAKLPYDTLRDFRAVSLVAASPQVLVATPSFPGRSVAEVIAQAKARPGQINYASSGNGSGGHLAMELFRSISRVSLVHVPYKGAGPAVVDLVGGQVQLMFTSPLAVASQVKAGKLAAIAIASAKRTDSWPDLPTVAESGVPGYEASLWYGLVAPAATPTAAITMLEQATFKAVRVPEVRDRFAQQGVDPIASTSGEFDAFLRREVDKWSTVVRASKIRLD